MSNIDDILLAAPRAEGTIQSYDGTREIAYEIRLLPPGRLGRIKIERQTYLSAQGIDECTTTTAEIYDDELRFRILAEAVLKPGTDEPLAPLETWRKTRGPAVDHCMQHYLQLEALEDPTDMELAAMLPEVEKHIKKNAGAGSGKFWKTIDYETLLACVITMALRPVVCDLCKSQPTPTTAD